MLSLIRSYKLITINTKYMAKYVLNFSEARLCIIYCESNYYYYLSL